MTKVLILNGILAQFISFSLASRNSWLLMALDTKNSIALTLANCVAIDFCTISSNQSCLFFPQVCVINGGLRPKALVPEYQPERNHVPQPFIHSFWIYPRLCDLTWKAFRKDYIGYLYHHKSGSFSVRWTYIALIFSSQVTFKCGFIISLCQMNGFHKSHEGKIYVYLCLVLFLALVVDSKHPYCEAG